MGVLDILFDEIEQQVEAELARHHRLLDIEKSRVDGTGTKSAEASVRAAGLKDRDVALGIQAELSGSEPGDKIQIAAEASDAKLLAFQLGAGADLRLR